MPNCINCGAPLPLNTIVCGYCKTRQDVDLKEIHTFTLVTPDSQRLCPRCNIPLQTIDLKVSGRFLIERCTSCFGLFFDNGELEALLEKSVENVFHIDNQKLDALQEAKRHQDYAVTYIKCPVCQKLMNRINFAIKSGVIVDRCRDHGMWLDGGELRQLLEWTKAGGDFHHQKTQLEMERLKLLEEKERLRAMPPAPGSPERNPLLNFELTHPAEKSMWGALPTIIRLAARILRY